MPVGNKDAEAQNLNYISNNRYLQDDFKGSTPLDFSNISSSGIMSQAPVVRPLQYIPEGGGGGGDDNTGPAPDLGEVTADDFGGGVVGDMGMTEAEQAGVDSINNARMSKMDMVKAGFATVFGGPVFGIHSAYKSQKKAKEEAIAEAKAAQTQRDFDAAMAQGDAFYDGLNDGKGASVSKSSRENAGAGFNDNTPGNPFAKGGRAGYFFGGRVNYKAGGRIGFAGGGKDAGKDSDFGNEDYGGNKDDNREQYGAVGQYNTGPTSTKDNGDEPKTFFNDSKTLYDSTILGNFPTGLTTKTPYGRLSAIMDLNKTLEEEDLEGKVQFDSSIGPVNTTTAFDTDIGPTFNASYNQGPVNIGYNNLNGINASYNKGPVSIGYNNGQATLGYSKSFAKGGRVNFKNGGLAGLL